MQDDTSPDPALAAAHELQSAAEELIAAGEALDRILIDMPPERAASIIIGVVRGADGKPIPILAASPDAIDAPLDEWVAAVAASGCAPEALTTLNTLRRNLHADLARERAAVENERSTAGGTALLQVGQRLKVARERHDKAREVVSAVRPSSIEGTYLLASIIASAARGGFGPHVFGAAALHVEEALAKMANVPIGNRLERH